MPADDLLDAPDEHLDPEVAAHYDRAEAEQFTDEKVGPAVRTLSRLAGDGRAVEFAVGTGRLALPLAETGVEVHGIDLSGPMLAQLAKKPGASRVHCLQGDMTRTLACTDAALVYLVFNTIMNLRTQEKQIACFQNAAAHLAPGGRFVLETILPGVHELRPGTRIRPVTDAPEHRIHDEYVDFTRQILVSHHSWTENGTSSGSSAAFRYVWPSELDLMARLAGLELESRWSDWDGSPFEDGGRSHVSVWRKVRETDA